VATDAQGVVEIDLATSTVTRSVSTPTPDKLALSPDGLTLYVTNFDPKTVSVFTTWYVGGSTGG
jgi:DNA-binding beta-propeller fold protein YncE